MHGSQITILVAHLGADDVARDSVARMEQLVRSGLCRPHWLVDADAEQPARLTEVTADGTRCHERLLVSLAELPEVSVAHVVTVASAALPPAALPGLTATTAWVCDELRHHQPAAARIVDARLLALTSLDEPTQLAGMFTPEADANLVLAPDDRRSDASFSVSVSLAAPAHFAGHMAVGVCTHAGLWTAMAHAPVAEGSAGVTGIGDPKVMIARSFSRHAVIPAVGAEEVVAGMSPPGPPVGCEPSPDPGDDAVAWAAAVASSCPHLRFRSPAERPDRRAPLPVRAAARLVARETVEYLREIPRRIRLSVASEVEELAGRSLQAVVGDEARVRVTWDGVRQSGAPGPRPTDASDEPFETRIASRRKRVAREGIPDDVRDHVIANSLALVDGGEVADVAPIEQRGRRVVLADLRSFGPAPTAGLDGVREQLQAGDDPESDSAEPGSYLATLLEAVRREWKGGEAALEQASTQYTEARARLERRRRPFLAVLNWVMAVLVAIVAVLVVLASSLPDLLGVDGWSDGRRALAWLVLSAVTAGLVWACVAPLRRGRWWPTLMHPGVVAFVLSYLAALVVGVAGHRVVVGGDPPLGPVRIGEMFLESIVVLGLVVVAALCGTVSGRRGAVAGRAIGVLALVHLSLSIVGGVVRQGSWYFGLSRAERWDRGFTWILVVLALMALTLLVIGWRRLRERLALGDHADRARWAEAAALDCAAQAERLRLTHAELLDLAAVMCRLAWQPFGSTRPGVPVPGADVADIDLANAMQIERFPLAAAAREASVARLRQRLTKPGWLQQQYARLVALAATDVAGPRPPQADRSHGELARAVFDGNFDEALFDEAAAVLGADRLAAVALGDAPQSAADRAAASAIERFGAPLAEPPTPQLPASFFRLMALPTADDPRAMFTTRLWWPTGALEAPCPTPSRTVHDSTTVDLGTAGLALAFIRADWSAPFPLSSLPICPVPTSRASNGHRTADPAIM